MQLPSDRMARLVGRISMGKVIRADELQSICLRIAEKIVRRTPCKQMHAAIQMKVARGVYSGVSAVINGKWIPPLSCDYIWIGRHRFKIFYQTPVGKCWWCDKPLFAPKHKGWHTHCNARLCRELHAVERRVHQVVRTNFPRQPDFEIARVQFVARFYLKKYESQKKEWRC